MSIKPFVYKETMSFFVGIVLLSSAGVWVFPWVFSDPSPISEPVD